MGRQSATGPGKYRYHTNPPGSHRPKSTNDPYKIPASKALNIKHNACFYPLPHGRGLEIGLLDAGINKQRSSRGLGRLEEITRFITQPYNHYNRYIQ